MSIPNYTKLHEAARNFAEAGIPVFPCISNSTGLTLDPKKRKAPACANGFKDATTDLAQIDAWWAEDSEYNIGACPEDAGWLVVDVEASGLSRWKELAAKENVPPTYTVETTSGGLHLYFAGSAPSSVRKLFKGEPIDTRGVGGYVLMPPSIVSNRPYKVLHERSIAPLPSFIAARLAETDHRASASVTEADIAANVARGRVLLANLVQRGDVAIEGHGGDARTYRLCCELLNLGISPDTTKALLLELWNPHCQPPWDADELETKITNAASYAQNEEGSWAVAPAAETFARDTLDRLAAESKTSTPERRSRFHPEDEAEQEEGDDPSWLFEGLMPDRGTILLRGRTGSYKSFISQEWAMAVAANIPSHGMEPKFTGPVFYGALEGRHNVKKARRRAWKIARGVESVPNFYVMPAPMIAMNGEAQEFGDQIAKRCNGRKPRLIVIDTVAKAMAGLNENDAGDAGKLIQFCDQLAEHFNCAVLAIGHTGKDEGRGARGSSAFEAGFDTVLEAKAHRATKSVAIRVIKHKDAEEREEPWTFEGRVIGPSLVFFPTSMAEHLASTKEDDAFDPKKVGAALQRLNAYGQEQAVTTHTLAVELTEITQDMTPETVEALKTKTARTLGALARSKLLAYCEKVGRDLMWSLPAPK